MRYDCTYADVDYHFGFGLVPPQLVSVSAARLCGARMPEAVSTPAAAPAAASARKAFAPKKKTPSAVSPLPIAKLEVLEYARRGELVSVDFEDGEPCYVVALVHAGRPSVFFGLRDGMVRFLEAKGSSTYGSTLADLATCLRYG